MKRVAIVTGAASGIGLAIAERLAEDGAAVGVFDLDGEAALETAWKIEAAGGTAIGVEVDVTDRSGVEAGVREVRDRLGRPLILVNNAGLECFELFLKVDVETWDRVLDVNLTGMFHCCQVLLPYMTGERWGRVVNISSSSAQSGQSLMSPSVAAKAAVIGLTKALALEFGPRNITVNSIAPGFVDTPMLRSSESRGLLGEGIDHHIEQTPVRRIGRPEDIAAMCSFLCSDEAGYVTGQVLGVNGGRNT